MEDDFADKPALYDPTHSTGDSGWQGVQEMNMRMGHAQGVEAYMPNMQHAQV